MQDNLPFPMDQQLQALMVQLQHPMIADAPKEKRISRHKFTQEEDDLLRQFVTQFGQSDWNEVSRHFANRSPRQCRDRWRHYISPDVLTGNWTDADDNFLLQKVAEIGPKWATITQLFPGRTDIGVKNHYISITGKKPKDHIQQAIMLTLGGGAQDGEPITDTLMVAQAHQQFLPGAQQPGDPHRRG
jgi:hypothetical protein